MPIPHAPSCRWIHAMVMREAPRAPVLVGGLTLLSWLVASPVAAIIVGGGGNANIDCLAVFEAPANFPKARPRHVRCTDGDPCDADGIVNGECEFPVGMCANSSFDPRCTLRGVDSIVVEHALDNGDPHFDPEFQALQTRVSSQIDPPTSQVDECTTPTNFHVKLKGPFAGNRCRRNSKLIRIGAVSSPASGRVVPETDRIKLTCLPADAQCSPRVLFNGTFDRVQRQIFNQSCAVSACHDSQSQQANLLLEIGASYGNLIDVDPSNSAAQSMGWKRIKLLAPGSGDPDASFLYHKITGDLGLGLGSRMPLSRPALDGTLIDIIRLWIEAGAPQEGWVPGTDS